MNELTKYLNKNVPTISGAKRALAALSKQLDSAKTYDQLKKIERSAEALKLLFRNVDEVKHECEIVILDARSRIGDELSKVEKAGGRPKKIGSAQGTNKPGRQATGIPKVSRHRLGKLAGLGKAKRTAVARNLQRQGKDATPTAVLREVKEEEIKAGRQEFEERRDKGARVADLVALAKEGFRAGVIVADPAWEFKVYSGKGKQRSAERHYDTSSLEAIKDLGKYVVPLMAPNCALLMWMVWPEMPGALEVIRSWGAEYKTVGFVWVKATKNAERITLDGDGLHWGMGYHTRANSEVCLLATRGNPQRSAKDVHQIVVAPVGEHSEKPDEVCRRVERLYIGPYLELFARKPRPGWTVWGNEIQPAAEAAE